MSVYIEKKKRFKPQVPPHINRRPPARRLPIPERAIDGKTRKEPTGLEGRVIHQGRLAQSGKLGALERDLSFGERQRGRGSVYI